MRNLGILSVSAALLLAVQQRSWAQGEQKLVTDDRPTTLPAPVSQLKAALAGRSTNIASDSTSHTYDMKQAANLPSATKPDSGTLPCPGSPCVGIVLFGEGTYLTARGADVGYARPMDGCTALAVPKGPVGVVMPEYSAGFRLGGELALDTESSIRVTYGWFDSKANNNISTDGTSFVVQALLTHPSTISCTAASLDASAHADIGFQTGDIDYHHFWLRGPNYYVDYVAGVRLAHLKQDFHAQYEILGVTSVDTHIHFDGIGPRVGLEGERVGCWGFLVYGRSSASFLVGRFGATYAQNNDFAGPQANTGYGDERIVPVLELELGVGWTNKSGRISLKAGYQVAAWYNTILTSDFIQSVQGANFTTNGDNMKNAMTFDGFVARLEFTF